jgi:hypothetical protein
VQGQIKSEIPTARQPRATRQPLGVEQESVHIKYYGAQKMHDRWLSSLREFIWSPLRASWAGT